MKKSLILSSILVSVFLVGHNVYAQESVIDYKQLIAKCSVAIKQAKSYNVEMEAKSSFTINSQENKGNSAKLNIAFVSPNRFKVAQVINEGSNENLWDGWIVIGNDYYVLNPVFGWAKGDDDNRRATCKANSPEGIIKQLEIIEEEYKRDSIGAATKNGIEYFVVKYLIGKESVNIESLPPELRDSKINGTHEIWINKNNYLPLKQSSEISYYSNEQNKGTSSTNINYSSYNNNKVKIDAPVLDDKVF
ncbi:MAG: hypothetical protein NTZ95_04015 [Candidatus Omnitrophica bacterium]|nr:hypothetical protein [Candidatus Omnitrophota bacterium]